MKISVKAKTGKHQAKVEKIDDTHYIVHVNARPEKGRANEAVLRLLSDYFDIPISSINIISGHTSQNKTVEIP